MRLSRLTLFVCVTALAAEGTALAQGAQPAEAPPPAPAPSPAPAPAPAPEPAPTPAPDAAPAPAPAPTPADEVPPASAPPPGAELAPEPPPPRNLAVGDKGLFRMGILLQGWFVFDHADETATTFRLRRAELHFKGDILPKQVSYEVMIDPAKVLEFRNTDVIDDAGNTVTIKQPVSAVSALQDFYITYLTSVADVSLGQFKIPVSWEGYNSSSKLLFPERAVVARAFGDKRDIGVRATKKFEKWSYVLGLWNGNGQNTVDNNNAKNAGLRLEVYPIEGLTLAGVAYDQIGDRDAPGTQDRWEGDARYEKGPLLLQSEFIRGRDVDAAGDGISSQGFYGAAGFKIPAGPGQFQPIARIGYFDGNVDTDDTAEWDFDVGANYYLEGQQARLGLSYSRFNPNQGTADNQIIFMAQLSY